MNNNPFFVSSSSWHMGIALVMGFLLSLPCPWYPEVAWVMIILCHLQGWSYHQQDRLEALPYDHLDLDNLCSIKDQMNECIKDIEYKGK